jgi:hypothetical protein
MWLSIGFVAGLLLLGMVFWLRSKKIPVAWYSWLLGGLGALLALFTVWNISTSLYENEHKAALTFTWLFGGPAVLLIGLAVWLGWWKYRRNRTLPTRSEA